MGLSGFWTSGVVSFQPFRFIPEGSLLLCPGGFRHRNRRDGWLTLSGFRSEFRVRRGLDDTHRSRRAGSASGFVLEAGVRLNPAPESISF